MLSAVDDVGHRGRQRELLVLVQLGDVFPHRHLADVGGGNGDGHRRAEQSVGTELRLVRCSVERDHRIIELALVERVLALEQFGDRAIDGFDGLEHALAQVDFLVAVAQFAGFEFTGGSAGRNGGTRQEPIVQDDIDFNGRIAARIENLTTGNLGDLDERSSDRLDGNGRLLHGNSLLGRSGFGGRSYFLGRRCLDGRSGFLGGNSFLGCCSFSDSGHFWIPLQKLNKVRQ